MFPVFYSLPSRMSEIKLTYFNIRARGETARLILAYAGIDYEDERIERGGEGTNTPYISMFSLLICLLQVLRLQVSRPLALSDTTRYRRKESQAINFSSSCQSWLWTVRRSTSPWPSAGKLPLRWRLLISSYFLLKVSGQDERTGRCKCYNQCSGYFCYFLPTLVQPISSVQVDEVVDAINDTFNKIVRLVQTNIFIFNIPGRGI